MALNSLLCADVPLRNCSLTHPFWLVTIVIVECCNNGVLLCKLQGPVYVAIYDYEAQDDDEASFLENDHIILYEMIDEGWMYGIVQRTGHKGMIPANYVELVQWTCCSSLYCELLLTMMRKNLIIGAHRTVLILAF